MVNELVETDSRWTPWAVGALRIVTALLFMEHGTSKIFFFPETAGSGPSMWSLLWVAGVMELVGSMLLLVGVFTRPVAFLLAGEMAIAYWTVHAPKSPFPVLNGGEAAILFCFIFLLLVATGSGAWSVDGAMRRSQSKPDGYRP